MFQQQNDGIEMPQHYHFWPEATSGDLTRLYASFSMQAEAFLLNRAGREVGPHRRGMCPEVKVQNLIAAKPPGHFGRSPEVCFWGGIRSRFQELFTLADKSTSTTVQNHRTAIHKQIEAWSTEAQ
eukprot:4490513-Pyramimonas_sp.AAC.1